MEEFWKFVDDNITAKPAALRLKYHGKDADKIDYALAITQIECRQKFGKKLADTLQAFPRFLFPSVLAGEQATSDAIAAEHARLVADGAVVADLTAGLGIDSWHLAAKAAELWAVEHAPERYQALLANFHGVGNLHAEQADCRDFIKDSPRKYDCIFIDPARRASDGSRVFALADCEPNVVAMLPTLQAVCRRLIVKMSPMLDISHVAEELPQAIEFETLGSTIECKELVAVAQMDTPAAGDYTIKAVTLLPAGGRCEFAFTPQQERDAVADVKYVAPRDGMLLYEPYPAVMKAAPFFLLAKRYGVGKLAPNTHIYVSNEPSEEFPGSAMEIEKVVTYESKHIKRLHREYPAISVTTRNFDVAADALRKKLGVRDGGDRRLFAVTLASGAKVMLICKSLR